MKVTRIDAETGAHEKSTLEAAKEGWAKHYIGTLKEMLYTHSDLLFRTPDCYYLIQGCPRPWEEEWDALWAKKMPYLVGTPRVFTDQETMDLIGGDAG